MRVEVISIQLSKVVGKKRKEKGWNQKVYLQICIKDIYATLYLALDIVVFFLSGTLTPHLNF